MVNSSEKIVAYQRKPGHRRAAIFRPARGYFPEGPIWNLVDGATVVSIVTPNDSESESEAKIEAERLIRKL
jgi:hypothetical protein